MVISVLGEPSAAMPVPAGRFPIAAFRFAVRLPLGSHFPVSNFPVAPFPLLPSVIASWKFVKFVSLFLRCFVVQLPIFLPFSPEFQILSRIPRFNVSVSGCGFPLCCAVISRVPFSCL